MKDVMHPSQGPIDKERARLPTMATQRKWLRVDGAGELSYVAVRQMLKLYEAYAFKSRLTDVI